MQEIQNHPVYQEVLKDSFGGIIYNIANRDKYDSEEIIKMWDALTPPEQSAAGGIMKGAFNFLKGN